MNGPMDVRPSSPPASWANCEFNAGTQEPAAKKAESLVLVVSPEHLGALGIDPESLNSAVDAARDILLGSEQTEWDNLGQELYDLEVSLSNGNIVPLGAISEIEYRNIEPSYAGDESTFILLRAN